MSPDRLAPPARSIPWARSVPSRVLALVLVGLPGCTAIKASVQIQGAMDARNAAEAGGAAEHAPYEHTMATRYLEKAWEELGSREYRTSVELARTSEKWSGLALTQAEKAPRDAPEDLVDRPTVPAPALPTPPPEGLPEAPAPTAPAVEPEASTP